MSGLVVVIPAFRAAARVAEVVHGARASGLPVVVIDDGSDDQTGDRAAEAGATVLRHAQNHGKGAALQTAFGYAERIAGGPASGVLTLDADGQHDPAEIPRLALAHRQDPAALVLGVRRLDDPSMPGRSRFGNRFSTWWISLYTRRRHTDSQSGFRVYPRRLYAGVRFRTTRFDTETELLLLAAKQGLPLLEVPIRTIYADRHETHYHGFHDSMRIVRLVIGSPWWRLTSRPAPPTTMDRPGSR